MFVKDNGIIILLQNERVSGKSYVPLNEFIFVDSESGRTVPYETTLDVTTLYKYRFYDLGNGMCLRADNSTLELMNANTYEVIAKTALSDLSADLKQIKMAKANGDGTLMLYHYTDAKVEVILLDVALNKVKSVSFPRFNNYVPELYWFGDDGFFYNQLVVAGNHNNDQYHVYRYDRCLEKMWESDVVANFVYYFENASGELFAYRSMLLPKRECYIDLYGSEEKYENKHEHDLTHKDALKADCKSIGHIEHWYCDVCGCMFLSDRQSVVFDHRDVFSPIIDHVLEIITPATAATCTSNGKTAYTKCTVCDKYFKSEIIPALGGNHTYGEWVVTKEATCSGAGEKVQTCIKCGDEITQKINTLTTHTYGEWYVSINPGCLGMGREERICVCGKKETRSIPALGGKHTYGEWVVTKEATCGGAGEKVQTCIKCGDEITQKINTLTTHTYGEWYVSINPGCLGMGREERICVCGKKETRSIPALGGKHTYGEWVVTKEATCGGAGEKVQTCIKCGDEITRKIDTFIPHTYGEWTVTQEPTYDKEGKQTRTCSVCGLTEKKSVKKLSDKGVVNTEQNDTSLDDGGAPIMIFAAVAVIVFAGGVITAVVIGRKKKRT